MLGKAAARAWKAARDHASSLTGARTATTAAPTDVTTCGSISSNSHAQPALVGVVASSSKTSQPACPHDLSSSSRSLDTADDSPMTTTAAETAAIVATAGSSNNSSSCMSGSVQDEAATASAADTAATGQVPCSPRTAAAAAAQLLAAAAASSDPVESVKLHLAALGVKDPADVSRTLMGELGERTNLDGLLQAVAGYLEQKGLPRRLNKKSSLKITKELNKRCAAACLKTRGLPSTAQRKSATPLLAVPLTHLMLSWAQLMAQNFVPACCMPPFLLCAGCLLAPLGRALQAPAATAAASTARSIIRTAAAQHAAITPPTPAAADASRKQQPAGRMQRAVG